MNIIDSFNLDGQVAVITGGGRGIGEGIAHALAQAGACVVLGARRENEVAKVAEDIIAAGGKAVGVGTDVTDQASIEALADAAVSEYGGLNIWVNNAGGSSYIGPMVELSAEEWQATLDLNLTAVWACSVAAAKRMTDGGSIINISSRAAWGPVPGSGHYAAAKAGVHSLTATMAAELAPAIRVNTIAPGMIPTEISMKALGVTDADLPKLIDMFRIPMKTLGEPADIGAAVLYFASSAGKWVTGQILPVTGGS